MMKKTSLLAALFLAACSPAETQEATAQKMSADAQKGAPVNEVAEKADWFISAANPYAAKAGAEILRKGGSAVDAAIATQAVLGLVEPQSSGLGGGAFLLHFDPSTQELRSYDGREIAPASATGERFLNDDGTPLNYYDAVASGLSVGVPGAPRLLEHVHQRHGTLEWASLFEGAAALADEGFEVSSRLNGLLSRFPRLKQSTEAAAYFYDASGAPRPVGHVLKNPAYAKTLRALASGGADVFYDGPLAEEIVAAVNSGPRPGGMTLDDLKNYQVVERDPVCGPYRAYQVCSMAPPSSGGVTTLQILAFLQGFDLAKLGVASPAAQHLVMEASRLAYADRAMFLADNDMSEGAMGQADVVAGLLNPAYLQARAGLIDPAKAATSVSAGNPGEFAKDASAGRWQTQSADASPEPPSTTHFTIVDSAGRVVSMTSTVEFAFGAHRMAGGMILNNQLTDFSFLPVRDGMPVANAVAPFKRPRSSMAPVIVFDEAGQPWAAMGSPGGPAIIGFVVKTLIGMIDGGLSAQEAIELPNIVVPRGEVLAEEGAVSDETIEALRALGHNLRITSLTSGVHAFKRGANGALDGGADPRREGVWLSGPVEQ